MQVEHITITSVSEVRKQLEALESERALAVLVGLDDVASYMDDLLDELAATRAAYVGVAVTEIASLRAALSAPLEG